MTTGNAKTAAVAAEADPHGNADQEITEATNDLREQDIAALAYGLWEARGCPEGSPEIDWFAALEQLRSRDLEGQADAAVASNI